MKGKLGNKTGNVCGKDLTVASKRLNVKEGLVLLHVLTVMIPAVCCELSASPLYFSP